MGVVLARDVAAKILEVCGPLSSMKLQKLCYYAHAWHMVWREAPMFSDEIQAWANGPVIPALYELHKGQFIVSTIDGGDACAVDPDRISTITNVLVYYGDKTAQWLSDLTHLESPWINARKGLPHGSRSNEVISNASIHEYYSGLS